MHAGVYECAVAAEHKSCAWLNRDFAYASRHMRSDVQHDCAALQAT